LAELRVGRGLTLGRGDQHDIALPEIPGPRGDQPLRAIREVPARHEVRDLVEKEEAVLIVADLPQGPDGPVLRVQQSPAVVVAENEGVVEAVGVNRNRRVNRGNPGEVLNIPVHEVYAEGGLVLPLAPENLYPIGVANL